MKNYKYREHECARTVLEHGFQTSHTGRELRLAAMYCREVFSLDKAGVRRKMTELCGKCLPDYNEARYYKLINYAVREAFKKGNILISIEEIQIYAGELDYIESLSLGREQKKVLLALLVCRKLSKEVFERKNSTPYTNICFGGGKAKYSELKKMSNIPTGLDINSDVISVLCWERLINVLHNGLITLDWIYNTSETGDVVLRITDFQNVGFYYDRLHGDRNIKECSVCGGLYRVRVNNQRYCCKECSVEADLIKARARARRRRMAKAG